MSTGCISRLIKHKVSCVGDYKTLDGGHKILELEIYFAKMNFQLFAMMQLIGAMIPMSGMMQIPGKKQLYSTVRDTYFKRNTLTTTIQLSVVLSPVSKEIV